MNGMQTQNKLSEFPLPAGLGQGRMADMIIRIDLIGLQHLPEHAPPLTAEKIVERRRRYQLHEKLFKKLSNVVWCSIYRQAVGAERSRMNWRLRSLKPKEN